VLRALLPVLALLVTGPAGATDDGRVTIFTVADPMPASVRKVVTCGSEDDPAGTRRPFAGGFAFTARCPGNHANWIQAVVFASTEDGADARLLLFPQPPGRGEPADSLSNIRWDPARREVAELFVDPERRICRTEARWRLAGPTAQPRLVFWRETRDCKGRWRVPVGRR
jgi:hypothetical protein